MRLKIEHVTRYTYTSSVNFSRHNIFLCPRDRASVRVESYKLNLEPEAQLSDLRDEYDNKVTAAVFASASEKLEVRADITVELKEENPFDFLLEPYAIHYPFAYRHAAVYVLQPYVNKKIPQDAVEVLPWFYRSFPEKHDDTMTLLVDLNRKISESFTYIRRDEEGTQSPDETIAKGSGTCRDFAVLFIEVCRQAGFAARFVSGYLYDPPTGEGHFTNRAEGSMHAWAEVYLPGAGWKGFDPTNGIMTNHFFIPTAVARKSDEVSPIQGTFAHDGAVESQVEVILKMEECL